MKVPSSRLTFGAMIRLSKGERGKRSEEGGTGGGNGWWKRRGRKVKLRVIEGSGRSGNRVGKEVRMSEGAWEASCRRT